MYRTWHPAIGKCVLFKHTQKSLQKLNKLQNLFNFLKLNDLQSPKFLSKFQRFYSMKTTTYDNKFKTERGSQPENYGCWRDKDGGKR